MASLSNKAIHMSKFWGHSIESYQGELRSKPIARVSKVARWMWRALASIRGEMPELS